MLERARETHARKLNVANVEEASLKKAGVRFRPVVIEETESRGCLEKKEKKKKRKKCQTRLETEDSLTGYRAMISERASVG